MLGKVEVFSTVERIKGFEGSGAIPHLYTCTQKRKFITLAPFTKHGSAKIVVHSTPPSDAAKHSTSGDQGAG